jgi:hypothetical protein
MNTHILAFILGVLKTLKEVSISLDHPESPEGCTFIAITSNVLDNTLIVEFKPGQGFGFYANDAAYGEGPEKIFATAETALDYFKSLITLTGEYVVVRETGDADNVVEGGYNFRHKIITHNITGENGIFEYVTRIFPSGVVDTGKPPRTDHIQNMTLLMDDEIALLRDRGVQVKILPKK